MPDIEEVIREINKIPDKVFKKLVKPKVIKIHDAYYLEDPDLDDYDPWDDIGLELPND